MAEQIPPNIPGFQYEPRYNADEIEGRRLREEAGEDEGRIVEPEVEPGAAIAAIAARRNLELQERLHGGVIPVGNWCACTRCRVPQNPTPKMCQCCREHDQLDGKREDHDCIVDHPDFTSVSLTPAVLHMVVNSMEEVRGYRTREDWSNRLYRLVAYRAYTYWIYQRLGRYNRKVIPACVVTAIRLKFPEANEDRYVSFKEADGVVGDEVGDAWHL